MPKVEVHFGEHAADVFHRHIGLCLEVALVGDAGIRVERNLPAQKDEITASDAVAIGKMHGPVPVIVGPHVSSRQPRAVMPSHGHHIIDDHEPFGTKGLQAESGGSGAGLAVVTCSRQRGRCPVLGSAGFDVEKIGFHCVVDVGAELSQQAVDPAQNRV